MLQTLRQHDNLLSDPLSKREEQQPAYARNAFRSIKPEIEVLVGMCTKAPVRMITRAVPPCMDAPSLSNGDFVTDQRFDCSHVSGLSLGVFFPPVPNGIS